MDGDELQQERSNTPSIRSPILTFIYRANTQKRASWDINYSQQSAYQVLDPETVETCAINQVQMRRL